MSKIVEGSTPKYEWAKLIKVYDFKNVPFFDIVPLVSDKNVRKDVVSAMADMLAILEIDIEPDSDIVIAMVESRGFIVGTAFADYCDLDLIPVRKAGKLPGEVIQQQTAIEYGEVELEIQKDAIKPGTKVIVIDDVLATGGTLLTAAKMIEELGGEVIATATILEVAGAGGRGVLNDAGYLYDSLLAVHEDKVANKNS